MLKSILVLMCLSLCLFLPTLSVYRVSAASTAVVVDPPLSVVNWGDTFTVNVNVTNIVNFTSWQLDLFYLNTVLNCTNVVEGPFLRSGGGGTYFSSAINNNYNSTNGRLEAYSTILGNTSVNGGGVILTVTLKAIGGGSTPLTLANTVLGDANIPTKPIPHVDIGGTVTVTAPPHDIAVTNLTVYKTILGNVTTTCNITATVANQGSFTESFNVTAYANATVIAVVKNVILNSLSSTDLVFTFNATGFAIGNYTLKVAADVVPGETNTANNNFTGGWIYVSILGDLTGGTPSLVDFVPDGKVDMKDVAVVAKYFGQNVPPGPSNCDVTGPMAGMPDGKIDMRDIGLVAKNFGHHI